MDFRRLDRALKQSGAGGNSSIPLSFTDLSPNILEALIPGYGLITRFLPLIFGLDISIVLTYGLLFFALISGAKYFWRHLYSFLQSTWMCNVTIDGKDDLFRHVLGWVSEQNMTKESRRLIAVTNQSSPQEDESVEEYLSEEGLFHFGKWAAKKPPRYEPAVGTHWFWFHRRFFIFNRSIKENRSNPYQNIEEHRLTIRCVGRSTEPLKQLIEHIKMWAVERHTRLTTIKRPTGKDQRRPPGHWSTVTSRPYRPLNTVVLDPDLRNRLVADVNEYLHPASPKWYATRGIPYRRGYLFHGPPGTGKSSLSFALAGLFGLDIHVISLNEQGHTAITESELIMLFNGLPRRCIVLLEDIDSAGLSRDHQSDENQETSEAPESAKDAEKNSIRDLARELGRQRKTGNTNPEGISLSGLLNAIDGVASHEGRVLVMTTNHPERLDKALIRPGRVDMQIKFTLSTRHQIREIFMRMYEEEGSGFSKVQQELDELNEKESKSRPSSLALPKPVQKLNGSVNGQITPPGTPTTASTFAYLSTEPEPPLSQLEIEELADKFADKVPEDTFSPAEVQSFLIIRKKRPRRALAEVDSWRDELMKARKEGKKMVGA